MQSLLLGMETMAKIIDFKIMDRSNKVDAMPTLLTVKLSSTTTMLFTYNSANRYTYTQWIRHMY